MWQYNPVNNLAAGGLAPRWHQDICTRGLMDAYRNTQVQCNPDTSVNYNHMEPRRLANDLQNLFQ